MLDKLTAQSCLAPTVETWIKKTNTRQPADDERGDDGRAVRKPAYAPHNVGPPARVFRPFLTPVASPINAACGRPERGATEAILQSTPRKKTSINTRSSRSHRGRRRERNGVRGGSRDRLPHQGRLRRPHGQGQGGRQAGTCPPCLVFPDPHLSFLPCFLFAHAPNLLRSML